MYAIVLFPVDNLILHTFRTAELGFLGLVVYIFEQTPLRCGQFSSSGALPIGLERFVRHPRNTAN